MHFFIIVMLEIEVTNLITSLLACIEFVFKLIQNASSILFQDMADYISLDSVIISLHTKGLHLVQS